jgi:F0F1-type ATP synthase membrane subunit a
MLMRSALRLALIAFGSCGYAGLAILGWGGFRPFFSHPALIALGVVLFALSVVSFFAGEI